MATLNFRKRHPRKRNPRNPLGAPWLDILGLRTGRMQVVLDIFFGGSTRKNLPGLVNIQKTMERSTIFNGKTHYFYGDFQ